MIEDDQPGQPTIFSCSNKNTEAISKADKVTSFLIDSKNIDSKKTSVDKPKEKKKVKKSKSKDKDLKLFGSSPSKKDIKIDIKKV